MKYSVSILAALATLLSTTAHAESPDPHYTPPSENIKNFFKGTWEGSFQLGYAIPQSDTELDNGFNWAVGVYHDIGSRMATEIQYMSTGDLDSTFSAGADASVKANAFIASLRGYGKPGLGGLTYFGRMGVAFFDVDFDNGSTVTKSFDSGTTYLFGFGAEKKTNEKTTFTLELTYYGDIIQDGYMNTINFGVRQALAHW